jgi:hypothetical protein
VRRSWMQNVRYRWPADLACSGDVHDKSSFLILHARADDEVSVSVVKLPEFSARSYHVDADGTVGLPLIGRIQAGGLSMAQFESELRTKLHSQVQDPHVVVSLVETRSVPVSVMGEVNSPGMQQLQGQRTLFDVLASAGGLKTDAGDTVIITRQPDEGPLSVAGSTRDAATGRVTAAVRVHDVVDLGACSITFKQRWTTRQSLPASLEMLQTRIYHNRLEIYDTPGGAINHAHGQE